MNKERYVPSEAGDDKGSEKKKPYIPPIAEKADADSRMNQVERELSHEYAIAAKRMADMGLVGNVDLVWENTDSENWQIATLKGVINGQEIELRGPGAKSQDAAHDNLKTWPASHPQSNYSGTIGGRPLESLVAQNIFGKFMGIAIEKEKKLKAQKIADQQSKDALIERVLRFRDDGGLPYPGKRIVDGTVSHDEAIWDPGNPDPKKRVL